MREWTFIDKSIWPKGEWSNEPDKVQWVDKETNLDCLAVRHPRFGHWCGYVGVSKEHKYFEKDYDDCEADVHGGLTFADKCEESEDNQGVCHIPEKGRAHDIWWLGFDCNHSGDIAPAMIEFNKMISDKMDREHPEYRGFRMFESYKTLDYVKEQCADLATQLKEVK